LNGLDILQKFTGISSLLKINSASFTKPDTYFISSWGFREYILGLYYFSLEKS